MKRYFNSSTKSGTGSRRYSHNHPELSQRIIAALKQLKADSLGSSETRLAWSLNDRVYELSIDQNRVEQILIHTLPLAKNAKPRVIKLVSNHLEENGQPIAWSAFEECLK